MIILHSYYTYTDNIISDDIRCSRTALCAQSLDLLVISGIESQLTIGFLIREETFGNNRPCILFTSGKNMSTRNTQSNIWHLLQLHEDFFYKYDKYCNLKVYVLPQVYGTFYSVNLSEMSKLLDVESHSFWRKTNKLEICQVLKIFYPVLD